MTRICPIWTSPTQAGRVVLEEVGEECESGSGGVLLVGA